MLTIHYQRSVVVSYDDMLVDSTTFMSAVSNLVTNKSTVRPITGISTTEDGGAKKALSPAHKLEVLEELPESSSEQKNNTGRVVTPPASSFAVFSSPATDGEQTVPEVKPKKIGSSVSCLGDQASDGKTGENSKKEEESLLDSCAEPLSTASITPDPMKAELDGLIAILANASLMPPAAVSYLEGRKQYLEKELANTRMAQDPAAPGIQEPSRESCAQPKLEAKVEIKKEPSAEPNVKRKTESKPEPSKRHVVRSSVTFAQAQAHLASQQKPASTKPPTPTKPVVEGAKDPVETFKRASDTTKPATETNRSVEVPKPVVAAFKPTTEVSKPLVEAFKRTIDTTKKSIETKSSVEVPKPAATAFNPTAKVIKPPVEVFRPTVDEAKPAIKKKDPSSAKDSPIADGDGNIIGDYLLPGRRGTRRAGVPRNPLFYSPDSGPSIPGNRQTSQTHGFRGLFGSGIIAAKTATKPAETTPAPVPYFGFELPQALAPPPPVRENHQTVQKSVNASFGPGVITTQSATKPAEASSTPTQSVGIPRPQGPTFHPPLPGNRQTFQKPVNTLFGPENVSAKSAAKPVETSPTPLERPILVPRLQARTSQTPQTLSQTPSETPALENRLPAQEPIRILPELGDVATDTATEATEAPPAPVQSAPVPKFDIPDVPNFPDIAATRQYFKGSMNQSVPPKAPSIDNSNLLGYAEHTVARAQPNPDVSSVETKKPPTAANTARTDANPDTVAVAVEAKESRLPANPLPTKDVPNIPITAATLQYARNFFQQNPQALETLSGSTGNVEPALSPSPERPKYALSPNAQPFDPAGFNDKENTDPKAAFVSRMEKQGVSVKKECGVYASRYAN